MWYTLLHKVSDVWQRICIVRRAHRKALLWFAALLLLQAGCHPAILPKPGPPPMPSPSQRAIRALFNVFAG